MITLDGPRLNPRQGGAPAKLVILLHGYGSNGDDLIQLAPHFARDLPDAAFVSPHAPDPVPGSPGGYQWFPITQVDPHLMAEGARAAAPVLDAFIDQELARYRLTEANMALVGFSQGTMMSLYVGARREAGAAAILGYSGAMPGAETLKEEVKSKPPVMLIHGDADNVVPPGMMFHAAQALCEAGLWAQWHISPGVPHSIGQDGLDLGVRFLRQAFAGKMKPAASLVS